MERDDLRRADALNEFWDQLALGRAPLSSRTVDDETADLLGRLQALGDPPELDSARERVWRDLQQHARWKEPDMSTSTFSLNLHSHAAMPPASPPTWPLPQSLSLPARGRQFNPRWALAQAATLLLLIGSLVAALYFLRPNEQPVLVPAVGTPVPTEIDDWPTFKGNAARDGRADAGPLGDPVERWRFQAGGPINPPPAVVGGVAYAGAGDGFLYAIDVASGEERWRYDAGNPVGGSPTVADGVVYVADGAGILHAVDAKTGEQRWQSASIVATASTPAVVGDLIYIGTGSLGIEGGELLAIDIATGAERWRFAVADQGEVRTPAVANGLVYVGSEAGGFVAIDALSGEERWRADTGDDSTGTAVVAEGIAYIGGSGDGGAGHLYAFDAETGEELWRLDDALYSPAVADGVAYSASFAGTFAALDTATGDELWRVELPGPLRPPAIANGIIYVPSDGDHAVYALDAATGTEQWEFGVDGGIDGAIAVADGSVYVGTSLGSVYAIGGSDTTTLMAPNVDAGTPAASAGDEDATPISAGPTNSASPVEFLWESSGGDQPFDQPGPMAIDPEGRLWVTDGKHSAFQIFEPDGAFVESWGTPGDGDGEFNFVRDNGDGIGDIAFAPDGGFYVPDSQNRRVQRFDAQRQFVSAWGEFGTGDGQFLDPTGVFVDADGNVLVIDDKRDDVQKFDREGNFLFTFAGHGTGEGQLNFASWGDLDPDGNLLIADFDNHRVQAFAPDGTFLATLGSAGNGDGQFNGPVDLSVAADGTIYVTDIDNHRVQIFDANGQFLAAWGSEGTGPGQFLLPIGVELDGQGNIYVTDVVGNRLQKFRLLPMATPEATPVADQASGEADNLPEVLWTVEGGDGGLAIPGNLAIDPQGQIWVADNGNDRFQIFDAEGQFREAWGEPGTGDGQFRLRRSNGDGYGGIAFAPDGTFYVLDPGNARIQKFDQDRQFVMSWGGFGDEPGQFLEPVGLAVDTAGTVWVVDDMRNDVQHFDANGELLGAFVARPDGESQQNAINGLAVDVQGNLYLSDIPGFQVLALDPDGTPRRAFGERGDGNGKFTDQPLAMAVDADGRLFVSEGPRIHVFAPDGQPLTNWSEGAFPLRHRPRRCGPPLCRGLRGQHDEKTPPTNTVATGANQFR